MNPTLHILRAHASFSGWWYLVPFALCASASATVVVAQALAAADPDVEAVVEVPVVAPLAIDAHGA